MICVVEQELRAVGPVSVRYEESGEASGMMVGQKQCVVGLRKRREEALLGTERDHWGFYCVSTRDEAGVWTIPARWSGRG